MVRLNFNAINQKTVAAASLSQLTYLGQSTAESATLIALIPNKVIERVIFDNLTYLDLEPSCERFPNDYKIEDGVLTVYTRGIEKLIEAGVESPIFAAMQGKKIKVPLQQI